MTIRVLLADDQSLLRATFKLLLDTAADIAVVAEAADGAEAVRQAGLHRPDVVLMDIRMPGVDGVEATRLITADPDLTQTRILVLSTFEDDELVIAALHAGASGYLGKGVEPARLIEAIRTVSRGDPLLSPAATSAVVDQVLRQPIARPQAPLGAMIQLTLREREITTLVASGLTNEQIGQRLFISTTTAKTHVNRAMTKVGARTRSDLVVFAYESGLITPGRPPHDESPRDPDARR